MTDVDLHETLNGYRGAIGKLVFRRFRGRISRQPQRDHQQTAERGAEGAAGALQRGGCLRQSC